MMNTLEALKFRYACRNMSGGKEILRDDLDKILEAGRLSPSSLWLEHWHFIVVKGSKKELKKSH